MFTKRHYKVIATELAAVAEANNLEPVTSTARETILLRTVQRLCVMFKADNPNFNESKFYNAVYVWMDEFDVG